MLLKSETYYLESFVAPSFRLTQIVCDMFLNNSYLTT